MRKYFYIFVTALSFLVGCSKDDVKLSPNELYQTVWEATFSSYDYQLVVEFLTTTEGKSVSPFFYETRKFQFSIVDDMMTFNGGGKEIEGDWFIISYSKEQIILHAYVPYEKIMTLSKIELSENNEISQTSGKESDTEF